MSGKADTLTAFIEASFVCFNGGFFIDINRFVWFDYRLQYVAGNEMLWLI